MRAPEGLCMTIRARITFVLLKTSSCPSGSTSPRSAKRRSAIAPARHTSSFEALRSSSGKRAMRSSGSS